MADMQTEGRVDRIKGRLRSTWGALTDDDIEEAKGDTESLIGRIKERTGEAADDIRRRLDELMSDDEK